MRKTSRSRCRRGSMACERCGERIAVHRPASKAQPTASLSWEQAAYMQLYDE